MTSEYEPPPQIPITENLSTSAIWRRWLFGLWQQVQDSMVSSFDLEVSRGNVTGVKTVNKFGRCVDNVDSADTDIWDGASGGTIIWVAPTEARIHSIVSGSANDDDNAGTGAYSVTVYGLTDWDTAEVSETVLLAGVTPVNTVNSYVIIHRMVCNFGATSTTSNAGIITATAATDATVTAQIAAGEGQTQMAIYGIPSTQSFYMNDAYGGVNRAVSAGCNMTILFNPSPDVSLTTFLVKSTFPAQSAGETLSERIFKPPAKFAGPGILKMQGNGTTVNLDVSAGFGGYLVTE